MVADTREKIGATRLRPLNQPRPVRVRVNAEVPVAVEGSMVAAVAETWLIEDEWWRTKPIRRTYWRLTLENGSTIDVFWDHIGNSWYRQAYSG